MKTVLMTGILSLFLTSAAFADTTNVGHGPLIGGGVELEMKQNANDDWFATTTVGVGINMEGQAFGGFSVESVDGGSFTLDEWQLGTTVGLATVSIGDQGDIFLEDHNGDTMLATETGESVIVDMGGMAVALGFTDLGTDVTDLSNVQGSYSIDAGSLSVTAMGDYNLNNEDFTLGSRVTGLEVAGVGLGSNLVWDNANELFKYEADASIQGITAYVNGDANDTLQNVGAGYSRDLHGLTLSGDVNYNIDSEEVTPTVNLSFNF